ncbi:uncharacterized protein LOC122278563 [Carya illinoinensis]|uniref:uncharacterized protein LOC122278563 n=1 Tax=Carya illinoinensis TaxID=32201 RepID=UPI001C72082E|nr:uncharacterized protein LOC122278563 [Carya illinoinensis]
MRKRVDELAGTGELERMVVERSKPKRHQETRQGTRQSFSPKRMHPVNNLQDRGRGCPQKATGTGYEEVFVADRGHKQPKLSNERMVISFEEANREGVLYPHDDALVITLVIANYATRRMLVDNGSSANILFWEAFVRMGIDVGKLRLSPTPLKGFSGDTVQPIGAITLPVTAGTGSLTATTMTHFLVVKAPSSYNAILGRLTLNHLKAVTSTYHLNMHFLADSSVGGKRDYYPYQNTSPVSNREAPIQLLVEHRDIFAWSHEEMPGIDNKVIEHCLGVDPTHKAV